MQGLHAVLLDAGSLGLQDLRWQHLKAVFSQLDIHEFTAPEQVSERIRDTQVILTNKTELRAEHFSAAPRLKQVIVLATGINNVDLKAARQAGVTVCNNRDYSTESLVEHTLMLMLALARKLPDYQQQVTAGRWQDSQQFCLLEPVVQPLHGATLGIIGLGTSGRGVAQVARALGMQVQALQSSQGATEGNIPRLDLGELLTQSDVISIHCPLTDGTRNLLNRDNLCLMKPSALLINTARGGIVNEEDLVEALEKGWIAGAASDVLTQEPPRTGNPLLSCHHPNLIITPHIAWASVSSRQALIDQTVKIAEAFTKGSIINCVNP